MTKRVIYISGYGRSGSTILDVYLSNAGDCFGAGELVNLFADWLNDKYCSCGEKISQCQYWKGVLADVRAGELERMREVTEENERLFSAHRSPGVYNQVWQPIFDRIFQATDTVIDSSKVSRLTYHRPRLLKAMGYKVDIVYLYRQPDELLLSLRKGSNRSLEANGPVERGRFRVFLGSVRGFFGWFIASAGTVLACRRFGFRRIDVAYEEFIAHPHEIAESILEQPIEQSVPDELDGGHGVSGNRTRRSATLKIRTRVAAPGTNLTPEERLLCFFMKLLMNTLFLRKPRRMYR